MPSETQARAPFRFPGFEFEATAGTLVRAGGAGQAGTAVKLDPQAARLLHLLLERAPAPVTRDQIRAALWPDKAFGEFDVAINTLIYSVRQALGDAGRRKRYVETLRGGGYRFLAAVDAGAAGPEVELPPTAAPPGAPGEGKRRRGRAWWWAATGAALAGVAYWVWPPGALPAFAPALASERALTHDGVFKIAPVLAGPTGIYFTEDAGGQLQLMRIGLGGGPLTRVQDGLAGQALTAISADGTRLLVRTGEAAVDVQREGPMFEVSAAGGAATPVGQRQARAAAFTPDGGGVAFADAGSLWRSDRDGGGLIRLAALALPAVRLAWSPDGESLVAALFDRRDGAAQLCRWDRGTDSCRTVAQLPGPWNEIESLRWSRRGVTLIALPIQGAMQMMEVAMGGFWAGRVRMSPLAPGDSAAFVPGHGEIVLLQRTLDTGVLYRFEPRSGQFREMRGDGASELDRSPDGASVAYVNMTDRSLWRARADGSAAVQLTQAPLLAGLPRWSPDGKWIAFYGQTPGRAWRDFLVSSAGGAVVPLDAARLPGGEGAPTWSPDGRTIYFGTVLCNAEAGCGLYREDLAARAPALVPGSLGLRTARLSPDGRYLAALDRGRALVRLLDLRTGVWRSLAGNATGDGLAWSRDSRALFAENDRYPHPCIVRIAVATGAEQCAASLAGHLPATDFGLGWFGVDADDQPLIFMPRAQTEIFSVPWPGG